VRRKSSRWEKPAARSAAMSRRAAARWGSSKQAGSRSGSQAGTTRPKVFPPAKKTEQMRQPGIGRRRIRRFQMGVGQDVASPAEPAVNQTSPAGKKSRSQTQAETLPTGGQGRFGHGPERDIGHQQVGARAGVGGQHRDVRIAVRLLRRHEPGRPPDRRLQVRGHLRREKRRSGRGPQPHVAADQMVQTVGEGPAHPRAQVQPVGMGKGQSGPAAHAEIRPPRPPHNPGWRPPPPAKRREFAPGETAGHDKRRRRAAIKRPRRHGRRRKPSRKTPPTPKAPGRQAIPTNGNDPTTPKTEQPCPVLASRPGLRQGQTLEYRKPTI